MFEKIPNSPAFAKKSANYPAIFTLAIFIYLAYTLKEHLRDDLYMSGIDRVDFYIHEFGHVFFAIFGNEFLMVLGGTLMQLIIPILLLIGFCIQKDYFAVAFCYAWIGTNFFYISMYSGDAFKMELPLFSLGGGSNVIHDWYYIFKKLGVLEYTDLISNLFYGIAILFYIIFFVYASILIINRFREGKYL